MKQARSNAGALAVCLEALIDDEEFASRTDQRAAIAWLAETLWLWRKSFTKG